MSKKGIKTALLVAGVLTIVISIIIIIILVVEKREKEREEYEIENFESFISGIEEIDEDDIEKMELSIQSKEILDLIENNWDITNVNLGTRESTCDDYDIYFDEGIEVRTVAGKVFNIVFTKKYQGEIANGLTTRSTLEEIENVLGVGYFEMEQDELENEEESDNRFLIGYEVEHMYIFFSNNGVSIYPLKPVENMELLIEKIEELWENKDIGEFINNLTDIWNDFDTYEANEKFIEVNYALKGFNLNWNPNLGKRNIFI